MVHQTQTHIQHTQIVLLLDVITLWVCNLMDGYM